MKIAFWYIRTEKLFFILKNYKIIKKNDIIINDYF